MYDAHPVRPDLVGGPVGEVVEKDVGVAPGVEFCHFYGRAEKAPVPHHVIQAVPVGQGVPGVQPVGVPVADQVLEVGRIVPLHRLHVKPEVPLALQTRVIHLFQVKFMNTEKIFMNIEAYFSIFFCFSIFIIS